MPYKSEKIKISGTKFDRRIKLTEEQKNEIIALRGIISQRKCALMFNVSRRTIVFLWNPEKLEQNKARRQERGGWRQYYDKKKHRESMKNTRRYKQELCNRYPRVNSGFSVRQLIKKASRKITASQRALHPTPYNNAE